MTVATVPARDVAGARGGAPFLRASGLSVAFAGNAVLQDLDVEVGRGEILGLIGPNGAGKSTLVNVLTGYQAPDAGRVELGDADVTGWAPHRIARAGLARTFQAVRPFGRLTVAENVEVAAVGGRTSRAAARRRVDDLLERFDLVDCADTEARALPYGRERALALARALATTPDFALLDEPAAGLDESETERLLQQIREIRRDFGCGILIIEHDMPLIMRLCERVQVIARGRTLAVGPPDEVRRDQRVIDTYLAQSHAEPPDA